MNRKINFIFFRLRGFSRNLRNEATRNDKIYLHDLGVRKAAIGDFRPNSRAGVDYLKIDAQNLRGHEIKLSPRAHAKAPAKWLETYFEAAWHRVDRGHYLEFVAG